jgi:hypothetical protein
LFPCWGLIVSAVQGLLGCEGLLLGGFAAWCSIIRCSHACQLVRLAPFVLLQLLHRQLVTIASPTMLPAAAVACVQQ